jgi:transposase
MSQLLLSKIKGEILLFQDNHPAHQSLETKKFLSKYPRIKINSFPKYSPDLNPKENFWNYLRKKFLNNKLFETTEEMATGIIKFIESIPKKVVKKICSYEYLLR